MQETAAVLQSLKTSAAGLSEDEAAARLEQYGPNEVGVEQRHEWLHRLWTAVRNPLVILLMVLSILSYATDDIPGGTVMLVMVILGGLGTPFGPVIGAVAYLLLEEALSRVTEYSGLFLGPALLLVAIYLRSGIEGFFRKEQP